METAGILALIKENNLTEDVWKALCVAKIRSMIHLKTGIDMIETGAIKPSMISELMNLAVHELSEEIISRQRSRN